MKTPFAIAVIVAQVAVLAFMAAEREWVLRTGRVMYLRTAPVDPRDPMRGDYVRFSYEIARVPRALCRDGVSAWFAPDWKARAALRDRRVFAEVALDDEQLASVVALTDRAPAAKPFVRGRVESVDEQHVNVRFGVEAMFMEQGKAKALETSPKLQAGVPLNIEVAVSDRGLAVTRGYRWEPLGLALNFEWQSVNNAPAGQPNRRVLRAINAELKNHGEQPVAIVARPNAGSFRLLRDERWNQAKYRWVGEDATIPPATADAIKLLQPGEVHRERIDLTRPAWWLRAVSDRGDAAPIAWDQMTEAWGSSFRLEYVPAVGADRTGLPHAERLRNARLRSRAFGPTGGID